MLPIRDTIPSRNPPIVTWVLILVNSVVFLFELTMPEPALEQFFWFCRNFYLRRFEVSSSSLSNRAS